MALHSFPYTGMRFFLTSFALRQIRISCSLPFFDRIEICIELFLAELCRKSKI